MMGVTDIPEEMATMSRTVKVLLALLAMVLAVTGCTSDEGAGSEAGSSGAGTSQLDEVKERGTLRVAVLADFPPWSVQNASGDFEGYEVDVAKALAEAMGVKLELEALSSKNFRFITEQYLPRKLKEKKWLD